MLHAKVAMFQYTYHQYIISSLVSCDDLAILAAMSQTYKNVRKRQQQAFSQWNIAS